MSPEEKLRRFDELIAPNLASAYNLARWLTGTREDAEDIVQDACLRAYGSLHRLRGEDGRPWLLAIVRNASMTWYVPPPRSSLAVRYQAESGHS